MTTALRESEAISAAVERVRDGGLIAFPTETVWGLGADARSEPAVAGLRRWKGRGTDQPLSILVSGPESLEPLGFAPSAAARELARAHWPGPLTLVMRCRTRYAHGVARDDGAVGVRCSPHPSAARLARALEAGGAGPITATSLNRHGERPATCRDEARALCGAGPDEPWLCDPGPDCGGGAPSTVLDCTEDAPVVLRPGALPAEALTDWIGGSA